jgi:hypothetical protein
MSKDETRKVSLDELPELRRKTEAVSNFLHGQLAQHLETLRPLLAPGRVLGKHAGASSEAVWGDKALAEVEQKYSQYGKPFRLTQEFNVAWLTAIGTQQHGSLDFWQHGIELHPWEYTHEIASSQGAKKVTMTSPVRWIAAYASDTPVAELKRMVAGKEQHRPEAIRQFVVSTIVLQMVAEKNPGLLRLLSELRFHWQIKPVPELHDLPIPTLSFSLPSFRPSDDLILAATAFSGIPAFIELIDVAAARDIADPLKARIDELIR